MSKLPTPPQFVELIIGGETFTVRTCTGEPLFEGNKLVFEMEVELHPDDYERMQNAIERENG